MNLKYGKLSCRSWMFAAIVLLLCSMWSGTARAADRVLNNVSLSGPNPPSLGTVEVNQASTPVQLSADAPTPPGEQIMMMNGQPVPGAGFQFEWPATVSKSKFNPLTQNYDAVPANVGSVTITPAGEGEASHTVSIVASFPTSGTYQISFRVTGVWWSGTGDEFRGDSVNPITLTLVVLPPQLILDAVTFGGDNHPVYQDTVTPLGYETPHWKKGRAIQSPVCYTRNTAFKSSATFTVLPTSANQTIKIRGSACSYLFPEKDVALDNGSAIYPETAANNTLPNEIRPGQMFNITWAYSADGGVTWMAAGSNTTAASSSNQMYVTLDSPMVFPLNHTVVDVACRNSAGYNYAAGAVNSIWTNFASPASGVATQDGRVMRYWPQGYNTPLYLQTSQLVETAAGKCNAWSMFLADVFRTHGITARRSLIDPEIPPGPAPPGYPIKGPYGLYVNTSHPGQGNSGPIVTEIDGSEGDGLPDHFANFAHAVVKVPGTGGLVLGTNGTINTTVFDPSYGLLFGELTVLQSEQKWEDESVTHLFRDYYAAPFPTAPFQTVKNPHVIGDKETKWVDSY